MNDTRTDPEADRANLAARLRRTGDAIPVRADRAGLVDVHRRHARRRRRRNVLTVAASLAVTSGAVAGAVALSADDGSDATLVTATQPPATTPPVAAPPRIDEVTSPVPPDEHTVAEPVDDETGDSVVSTSDPPPLDVRRVEPLVQPAIDVRTFDVPARDVSASIPTIDDPPPPGFPADVVWRPVWEFLEPWADGFLLGRVVMIEAELGITSVEAAELLGDEMVVTLQRSRTGDPNSAEVLLGQEGFGERLDELLAVEPDLLAAYFGLGIRPALEGYVSRDGVDWEAVRIDLPDAVGSVDDIASSGDRLAVVGRTTGAQGWQDPSRSVWSTADLTTWIEQSLPVPDPSAGYPAERVWSDVQVDDLQLGGAGWTAKVWGAVSLDEASFVDDPLQLWGSTIDAEAGTLVLDLKTAEDSIPERVEIDLIDQGFTPEQVRAIRDGRSAPSFWSASWSSTSGRRIEGFDPTVLGGTTVTDTRTVLWSATELAAFVPDSGGLRVWRFPDTEQWIQTVRPAGDAVIVHATRPSDSRAATYEVDLETDRWTPLQVAGLPERPEARGPSRPDGVIEFSARVLPVGSPTIATFEEGDYRYTERYEQPRTSYEVTRISTGEVVVSETSDIRTSGPFTGGRFEFLDETETARTIADPETGEVVIDMDADELDRFRSSRTLFDGRPVPQYTWVDFFPRDDVLAVVTAERRRWFVHDVEEWDHDDPDEAARTGLALVAVNGDTLLREGPSGWQLFDLR